MICRENAPNIMAIIGWGLPDFYSPMFLMEVPTWNQEDFFFWTYSMRYLMYN